MGKQRFDIKQILKHSDGTDLRLIKPDDDRCKECGQSLRMKSEPMTLGMAFIQCLQNRWVNPETGRPVPASPADEYKRVRLSFRIEDAKDEIRLSEEEIVDLKELAPKFLSPLAYTRVRDILDPPEDEEQDKETP